MKILSDPVKQRRGHGGLSTRQSVRKADDPSEWHWFHYLGFMADMVVRDFDLDAAIEFDASGYAYRMIVKKREKTT